MMKKIFFFLILLFGLSQLGFSQKFIVINQLDSLHLSWSHDWKDVTGQPEHVVTFRIYASRDNGPFQLLGHVKKDTLNFRPDTAFTVRNFVAQGKYIFGVTAVDWAGNESDIEKSIAPDAAWGGWYLIFDLGKPRMPKLLKPLE